jgi:hypothetical protein
MTTVVLESQPAAGMTASPPAVVGPNATLLAKRQLLNNPPPTGASPSAAEQWCDDVDQLVIAAINTPHWEGGTNHLCSNRAFHQQRVCHPWRRCPWGCQVRARRCSATRRWPATGRRTSGRRSTAVEVGRTVAPPSSATVRGVETSRLATLRETSTCMHQWVRAKLHMRLSPLAPRKFQGGCMALAPHLRMVVWPPKFRPHLPEKYDGTVNPAEFL